MGNDASQQGSVLHGSEPSRIEERPDYLIGLDAVDAICEVGDAGRAVIASTSFASQSAYNPRRGRRVANVINDMFEPAHFAGRRIIELGPGHYAFALLARHLGADVVCVERDPAFVQLGRHLGFEVLDQDFNDLHPGQFSDSFDGLWAKGIFNACRPNHDHSLSDFVGRITALLKPDGWGWIVTVNKTRNAPAGWDSQSFIDHRVELQRQAFAAAGWEVSLIPDTQRSHYALNYANSHYFFTKRLARTGPALPSTQSGAPITPGRRDLDNGNSDQARTEDESSCIVCYGPADEPDPAHPHTDASTRFNRAFRAWQPHALYLDSPWAYYVTFIQIAKDRGARFITMSDALADQYDPRQINIVLDHHIDFYPLETEIMCRWEYENDVISSIYLFNRYERTHSIQKKIWRVEDLNVEFYQQLEKTGFEIGYHQNAVGTAYHRLQGGLKQSDPRQLDREVVNLAQRIFAEDVTNLRRYFNVRTFIPHGAAEGNNQLVEIPKGFERLTWVYNNARKGGRQAAPIKWRNFSDSSGIRPYPIRAFGARYMVNVDKLHVNAHLLSRGVNHILIHPGRFSRGMPYETYSQPEKMNQRVYEQYSFGGVSINDLPLRTEVLAKRWNAACANTKRDKMTDDEPVHIRNNKYYVISDDPRVLRRHMVVNGGCVPFLVFHNRLSRPDLREMRLPRNSRDPSARQFTMPRPRADSEDDQAFVEEFKQFINQIFTDDVMKHLALSRFPVDVLHLAYVEFRLEEQLENVRSLLRRFPKEGSLYIQASLRLPVQGWHEHFTRSRRLSGIPTRFGIRENSTTVTVWSRTD